MIIFFQLKNESEGESRGMNESGQNLCRVICQALSERMGICRAARDNKIIYSKIASAVHASIHSVRPLYGSRELLNFHTKALFTLVLLSPQSINVKFSMKLKLATWCTAQKVILKSLNIFFDAVAGSLASK
jgi:hypothetical protein